MTAPALVPALFSSALSDATNGAAGLTVRIVDAELRLCGELDVDGVDAFRAGTVDFPTYGLTTVIVDVTSLTFVDAAGVGALVGFAERLRRAGIRMLLTGPQVAVRRALEVASAIGRLDFRIISESQWITM